MNEIKPDIREIVIVKCNLCNRISFNKSWKNIDEEKLIYAAIKNSLDEYRGRIIKIGYEPKGIARVKYKIVIPKVGTKYDLLNITINVKKQKCPQCIKILGGYYEAVIQIRGQERNKLVKRLFKVIDKKMITKVEETKNGKDIYIIDKKYAKKIVSSVFPGCKVVRSFKFVSQKKGKKLYRDYYSVRYV